MKTKYDKTNTRYETTDAPRDTPTRNCNRGTALERSVEKLLGLKHVKPVLLALKAVTAPNYKANGSLAKECDPNVRCFVFDEIIALGSRKVNR